MKVKTTEYGNSVEILHSVDHYYGIAVMVSDAGVAANADGKKIVPAGTLVSGRATGAVSADDSAATEGVLLTDVDVTYGEAPGTMVLHGFIKLDKIPTAPSAAALAALPMIAFI